MHGSRSLEITFNQPHARMNAPKVLLWSICLLAAMGGCASKPTALYQWEGYQANLDSYFRGDKVGLEAQAQLMEADLKKIKAAGSAVPPGYSAHLALLYGQQGYMDKFAAYLNEEKSRFPESSKFVDFLSRNFKK